MNPDPLAAEVKVIERGTRSYRRGPRAFEVPCRHQEEHGTMRHRLTVAAESLADGSAQLRFGCDCPSGRARLGAFLPCYHAAAVARRLEREGLAVWIGGSWFASEKGRAIFAEAEPAAKKPVYNARGLCSRCHRYVSVKGSYELPEPRPEDHDPVCAAEYRADRTLAKAKNDAYEAQHGEVDLWAR